MEQQQNYQENLSGACKRRGPRKRTQTSVILPSIGLLPFVTTLKFSLFFQVLTRKVSEILLIQIDPQMLERMIWWFFFQNRTNVLEIILFVKHVQILHRALSTRRLPGSYFFVPFLSPTLYTTEYLLNDCVKIYVCVMLSKGTSVHQHMNAENLDAVIPASLSRLLFCYFINAHRCIAIRKWGK